MDPLNQRCAAAHSQAYRAAGKPLSGLSEAEQFAAALMTLPRAAQRLRAIAMRFSAAERATEAAEVLRVRHGCCICVRCCRVEQIAC
jgi:hypothetical protein